MSEETVHQCPCGRGKFHRGTKPDLLVKLEELAKWFDGGWGREHHLYTGAEIAVYIRKAIAGIV